MRRLVVPSIALALVACGIGLEGSLEPTGPSPDGADATADAGVDASLPPPPAACAPIVVNDALTAIDPAVWRVVKDGSNQDYPKFVPPPDLSPLPSPSLSLVIPDLSSRGGLWLNTAMPTQSFDVSFSVYLDCTSTECAEGLALAWLKTTDPAVLETAASGRAFGLPPTVAGAAVALDLSRNTETLDGPTPSVELLAIDGAQVPGAYPWVVATGPADTTLVNASRKVQIRARKGTVEVRVDGTLAASSTLSLGYRAIVGITAASGPSQWAGFYVRDFSGSFYDCDL